MSTAGGTLIKLKDEIHTKWFELQASKRSGDDSAFLEKKLYDDILELGRRALADLQQLSPPSSRIATIQKLLEQIEWKTWVADETRIGMKVWYAMTPDRATEVITQDFNRLANEIHLAGMNLIKATSEYCGCRITDQIRDLRSINTGVLRYCEGTLKLGDMRGFVHEPGDTVEHKPGAAANHANTIKFEPTEKGYNIDMEYVESGDAAWENRQSHVVDFIGAKGGKCEIEHITARCRIEDASEDDIMEISLLVSQLKDIDLLPYNCIDVAFDGVMEQIQELKQIEPATNIWKTPWTRPGDMDDVLECAGEKEEEYEVRAREERNQMRYERLEAHVERLADGIDYAIAKVKGDPCSWKAYSRLADADVIEDIRDGCQRIFEETDESHLDCMDMAKQKEQDLQEAAIELVAQCPAEPIILGLEAAQWPGYVCDEIRQITRICQMADDQTCLDVIRQVETRVAQGIYPKPLPFKEFGAHPVHRGLYR